MPASDPGENRTESGVTKRSSSPGAYAVKEPVASTRVQMSHEQRIEGIKAYHQARLRLCVLATELANAPAKEILPGVTEAYVGAMGDCLHILSMWADVAEGL